VSTQLPVECVSHSLSPRLKQPVSEASDSPPSNAKSNTSTFLCFHGTYRDNLTFYQKILFRSVRCHYFRHYRENIYRHRRVVLHLLTDFAKKWSLHRWKCPFFGVTVTKPQHCKFRHLRLTYSSELSHVLWASSEMLMRISEDFFCTLPLHLQYFFFIRLVTDTLLFFSGDSYVLSSSTAHLWVLP
jgi:hypothetical protein